MHLGARGFVHAELIDPETGAARRARRTAPPASSCSRTCATAPRRSCASARATTSHVRTTPVPVRAHRPARALHRAHRRHADRPRRQRLPVGGARGGRARSRRDVSGHILVRPTAAGVKQEPPLPVSVELARGATADAALARRDPRETAQRARRADARRARAVGQPAAQRVQVEARRALDPRRRLMRKLQSQGVHHITIVGADRQTSIDFWEGVLGMPFVFEQPNLDNAAESHLYFDPGDGRLITVFTNEERDARPATHADRPRLRAPPRVLALAGDVRPGRRAPRRARDPAQRRQGPRLHGLDLLRRPARAR